ncbi:hypothetical protein EDB80DRAFT_737884 [Ilyonectria destructans]|nr:hypothetical protein EDB80DRAFT_737884 [Ilyonectria destructans]
MVRKSVPPHSLHTLPRSLTRLFVVLLVAIISFCPNPQGTITQSVFANLNETPPWLKTSPVYLEPIISIRLGLFRCSKSPGCRNARRPT